MGLWVVLEVGSRKTAFSTQLSSPLYKQKNTEFSCVGMSLYFSSLFLKGSMVNTWRACYNLPGILKDLDVISISLSPFCFGSFWKVSRRGTDSVWLVRVRREIATELAELNIVSLNQFCLVHFLFYIDSFTLLRHLFTGRNSLFLFCNFPYESHLSLDICPAPCCEFGWSCFWAVFQWFLWWVSDSLCFDLCFSFVSLKVFFVCLVFWLWTQ